MRACPQPIIALLHGPAAGLGFSLALASDVRIAAESTRMNAAFLRVGLSGGDCGSSYHLPRLVGAAVASELLLTGRFIHAERALRVGLVSEVVPDASLEAAGEALVADMLRNAPLGLRLTKELLNATQSATHLEQQVALEDRSQVLCLASGDPAHMARNLYQMPLVILLLGWVGIVNPDKLRRNRKYALLVCAIVSAAITPADVVSMLLMLVPLYGLYEFGILLLHFTPADRVASGRIFKGAVEDVLGRFDGDDDDDPENPDAGNDDDDPAPPEPGPPPGGTVPLNDGEGEHDRDQQ